MQVSAQFLPGESCPEEDHFFFAYQVRIANEGNDTTKLASRHFIIIDSEGERHEVNGPGVVGETPTLGPGKVFEYTSFCPLRTRWGTMEGTYRMERQDGSTFDATIGRFYLVADVPEASHQV